MPDGPWTQYAAPETAAPAAGPGPWTQYAPAPTQQAAPAGPWTDYAQPMQPYAAPVPPPQPHALGSTPIPAYGMPSDPMHPANVMATTTNFANAAARALAPTPPAPPQGQPTTPLDQLTGAFRQGVTGFGKGGATAPLVNFGAAMDPTNHGILRGLADFASGLTSPASIGLMVGTGGLSEFAPVITRLLSLGFSADMLHGVFAQYPEFRAAIRQGNWPMVREIATKAALGTAAGGLALFHGVRGGTPKTPGAAEPAPTANTVGMEPGPWTQYAPPETKATPPAQPSAANLPDAEVQRLLKIETDPVKRGKLAVIAHQRGIDIPPQKPGARVPVQTLLEQKSAFEQAQEHEETWQRLFDEAEARSQKLAAKGARTKPVVPEQGAADERTQAARDDIARHFTGKLYAAISPDERGVVDSLIKEGYIGAPGEPPPPAPAVAPPAQRVKAAAAGGSAGPAQGTQPVIAGRGAPGWLDKLATAGAESDEWLRKNGITGGSSLSANRVFDPEVVFHLTRAVAGDVARGVQTARGAAAILYGKFRDGFDSLGMSFHDVEKQITEHLSGKPAAMPTAERLAKIRDLRKATGMKYKAAVAKVDAEAAPPPAAPTAQGGAATGGEPSREPWQVPKGEIVDYRDTLPRRTAPGATGDAGDWSEEGLNSRTLQNRASETRPPEFNRYPIGTYARDSDGELMQLRRYSLDDPRLIFPEGRPNPQNQTVQKYQGWIEQGSEPPPMRGLETEKGNIRIQEGHHRAQAIENTGGKTADVWVALTHNRPLGNGQVMPEGVTHEGAIRRAIEAGARVPDRVLRDYPELRPTPPETPGLKRGDPGWVGNVPTSSLHVDAPRFQFKQNVGQGGAGEEFREVGTWDPEKAGVISVWRDPADGKDYVVNGHHRYEMATRLGAPDMTVRYLDAKNAAEARTKGAMINIAEGRGETTDAAKVFRETGESAESLKRQGVSLKGKIADEGLGIAKLAQPLYDDVMRGDLSTARGAIIGHGIDGKPDQIALYDALKKREAAGKRLTNAQLEEMIRLAKGAPKKLESGESAQVNMFGEEEFERSLLPEKAEISEYVRKQLGSERKLFGLVGDEGAAARLGAAGNVIHAKENAQIAEQASRVQVLYDKLSSLAGDVDDALNQAAKRLADGENPNEVKRDAYQRIRESLIRQSNQLAGVPRLDVERAKGHDAEGPHQVNAVRPGSEPPREPEPAPRPSGVPEPEAKAVAPAPPAEKPLVTRVKKIRDAVKAGVPYKEAVAKVDEAPAPVNLDAKLPAAIQGSKPRYAYGPNQFQLKFESDIDRAAYVTAQKLPSKADAAFVKFVMDATGWNEAVVRAHGRDVSAAIKAQAKDAEGGTTLTVPDMVRRHFRAREAAPPEAPAAAVEPVPAPAAPPKGLPDFAQRAVNELKALEADAQRLRVLTEKAARGKYVAGVPEERGHHAYLIRIEAARENEGYLRAIEGLAKFREMAKTKGVDPEKYLRDAGLPERWLNAPAEPDAARLAAGPLSIEDFNRQAAAAHEEHKASNPQIVEALTKEIEHGHGRALPDVEEGPLFGGPRQGAMFGDESGRATLNTMLLGVPAWLEHDVKPGLRTAANAILDTFDDVRRAIAAKSRGLGAERSALYFRKRLGELARGTDQARYAVRAIEKAFDTRTKEQNYEFIRRYEKGLQQETPELDRIAKVLRGLYIDRRIKVQALGTGKLKNFYQNYFAHIWERPDRAMQVFGGPDQVTGRGPLEGSKAFLYKRDYPTIEDGIKAGLKPKSDNPVTLTLMKIEEMDKYIMAHRTLGDWSDAGTARLVEHGDDPPLGWHEVQKAIGHVYGPGYEETPRARWFTEGGSAQLLNNYLGPRLTRFAVVRAIMGINNSTNLFNLGMSGYHLGKSSWEPILLRGAIGMETIARRRPLAGAGHLLAAPFQPFTAFLKGGKLVKEWREPGTQAAALGAIMDHLTSGGARAGMDQMYRTTIGQKFMKAMRQGNLPGALARAPFAAMELWTKLVMDHVVPRLKFGTMADMATADLERIGPNASELDKLRKMAEIVDSVDNTMGEVARDNLFWNRYASDLAMILMRADQYFLGTVRQIGGGVTDIVRQPVRAIQGKPVNLKQLSYLASMLMFHTIASAIYQKLHTGKWPEEAEDYFYPKNGQLDENGRPQRSGLWSYIKDVDAFVSHPTRTLENKASGAISMFSELYHNEDFYHTEIRHPDDPALAQVGQTAKGVAKQYTPRSVEQYQRGAKLGISPELQAEQFFGITPANADVDQTPAERMAREFSAARTPDEPRTAASAERRELRQTLSRALRQGKAIPKNVLNAINSGQLGRRDIDQARTAARETSLQQSFTHLGIDEAIKVYRAATPAERRELRGPLLKKYKAAAPNEPPALRAQTLAAMRSALGER